LNIYSSAPTFRAIGTWRTQPTASYPIFTSLTAMKDPNKRDALPSSFELPGRYTVNVFVKLKFAFCFLAKYARE